MTSIKLTLNTQPKACCRLVITQIAGKKTLASSCAPGFMRLLRKTCSLVTQTWLEDKLRTLVVPFLVFVSLVSFLLIAIQQ